MPGFLLCSSSGWGVNTSFAYNAVEPYYHTADDNMEVNFSAERLKLMVDAVALAVYNDATANYVAVVGDGKYRQYYSTEAEAIAVAGEGDIVTYLSSHEHCVYGESCADVKAGNTCSHEKVIFDTPVDNTNFASVMSTPGRYYLTEDIELTTGIGFRNIGDVYLCLNGYSITAVDVLDVANYAKVSLCNCHRTDEADSGTYKDIVIKGDGTVLSFTFTGTGFDLLGTTDAKSGMLEYIIHTLDEQGAEAELYRGVLDTEYLAGEIHEAPLLHKELPYGRYRVEINGWVEYDWDATEGWVYDEELGWALPPVIPAYLRLDGVRIYNALSYEDTDREHYAEGEKEASFRQLRDMLLNGEATAASFDNEGRFQLGSGLISYVETGREGMSYKGNAVSSMDAYLLAGPNNEVYFNSDTQSIVFYVKETEAEAHRLQIGIRNLNPKAFGSDGAPTAPGVVVLGVDEKGESLVNTVVDGEGRAIGYTEQYYTVDYTKCVKETIGTEEYYRVVISSNKNTPFCISNVKYAGLAFAEIPQKEQDLSYDAQAQENFGFHEEFLANSTLTAQEQALATVAEPDIRSYMVQDDPTIPGSGSYGLSVLGASLSLKDKVELNFYLAPVTDTVEDKTMVIVYTDDKGEEITAEIEARDFVADSSGRYKATFSELTAKDMRTVVTCYLVDGDGVRVSNAMTYSIESYAASKIGNDTLKPLLTAMMKYGDSAESFFRPRNED